MRPLWLPILTALTAGLTAAQPPGLTLARENNWLIIRGAPAPKGEIRSDVNPRPLSPLVPDNGLIGCFSADETHLFAVAFAPHQELFQGVARCLHADIRFGGLEPGETKRIRGRIYILPNDVPALLARYAEDFPAPQPQ